MSQTKFSVNLELFDTYRVLYGLVTFYKFMLRKTCFEFIRDAC